jgi:hypothetical protein
VQINSPVLSTMNLPRAGLSSGDGRNIKPPRCGSPECTSRKFSRSTSNSRMTLSHQYLPLSASRSIAYKRMPVYSTIKVPTVSANTLTMLATNFSRPIPTLPTVRSRVSHSRFFIVPKRSNVRIRWRRFLASILKNLLSAKQ